jgi:hypothetical protein
MASQQMCWREVGLNGKHACMCCTQKKDHIDQTVKHVPISTHYQGYCAYFSYPKYPDVTVAIVGGSKPLARTTFQCRTSEPEQARTGRLLTSCAGYLGLFLSMRATMGCDSRRTRA